MLDIYFTNSHFYGNIFLRTTYILPVHMSNPITPQHFITANVVVVFQNRVDCISYNSEFVVGLYDLLKLQKSKCNYEASLKSN